MDKSTVRDTSVDNTSSDNILTHPPLNRGLARIRQTLSNDSESVVASKSGDQTPTRRPKQLLRLKRTAEELEQIEQTLLRRIGPVQTTDRATDKLICQLQIQTKRLLAQIGELIED